jgi:hypothetical protein
VSLPLELAGTKLGGGSHMPIAGLAPVAEEAGEPTRTADGPHDWVRPDFQEFAVAPEVTAYAGLR